MGVRDIIFRGKRTNNGEWVYGDYETHGGIWGEGVPCISTIYDDYKIITETVGQYTGMMDKNGAKIFEGDIVNMFGNRPMEVFWNSETVSWEVRDVGTKDCEVNHIFNTISLGEINAEAAYGEIRTEIIGTIYDNLELLDETK